MFRRTHPKKLLRSWRVIIIRSKGEYLSSVEAPDREKAAAVAVKLFQLDQDQRSRALDPGAGLKADTPRHFREPYPLCYVDDHHRPRPCARRRWLRDRLRSRLRKGSAIMADELAHLAQADQHIAGAKERINKQEELIERLAAKGHSVRDAEGLLSALTGVLRAFESHRLLILNRLRP